MATKGQITGAELLQIKVTLRDTKPLIWRRLLVPEHTTLAQLHRVLQITMGWENSHLYEFRVDSRRQADRAMAPLRRSLRLGEALTEIGASLAYMYDFGDGWEHAMVLEKRLSNGDGADYPVCIEGQLACPPEDCGGIPGYYNLLEILADPRDAQHAEMREWIGGDFNPQAFSADAVNRRLARGRARRGISA